MKKLYTLLTTTILGLSLSSAAQCDGQRYKQEVFSTFSKSTVTYSDTFDLQMDIYLPNGDSETNRPAILLAHGGAFIAGDRNEAVVAQLCERFVKRGYVCASIDYRLAASFLDMIGAQTATEVVVKSISDGKAAVRYLKLKADSLGIDPNRIIVGGNSAGAVLMLHLAYIDSLNEVSNEMVKNSIINNGGFEGNSGNLGPDTKVIAVVDWAGAILDTTWMSINNVPVINLHGNPDNTVPYNCGRALNGASQVVLCGPGNYNTRLANVGIEYVEKSYPGGGHQPWSNAAIFQEGDSLTNEFLYKIICANVGLSEINTNLLTLAPNPTKETLYINSKLALNQLDIYDAQGRIILRKTVAQEAACSIALSDLKPGYYILAATHLNGQQSFSKFIKQ